MPLGLTDLICVVQVDMNPAVVPVYTECLRLCGTWLADTCLESPGLILEKYLERVGGHLQDSDRLRHESYFFSCSCCEKYQSTAPS